MNRVKEVINEEDMSRIHFPTNKLEVYSCSSFLLPYVFLKRWIELMLLILIEKTHLKNSQYLPGRDSFFKQGLKCIPFTLE